MEYGNGEGRGEIRCVSDYWNPKIAAELNDSYIKLMEFKGEFVWHHHEKEDELFFMMKGRLANKAARRRGSYRPWTIGAVLIRCPKFKVRCPNFGTEKRPRRTCRDLFGRNLRTGLR